MISPHRGAPEAPSPRAIPSRFNLARHCLGTWAAAQPDRTALVVIGDADADPGAAERWSYGALDEAVRRIAAGLEAEGLAAGDRLMLRLPNSSDYALVFFGAVAAGLVPIPVSSQLTGDEAAFLLADSAAAAVATGGGLEAGGTTGVRVLDEASIARLKATPPRADYFDTAAEDPAYMLYTSGTSRRPKGVVHAHRVALGRAPMHRWWQGIGPGDTMLHAGAFNWSYTLGVGLLDPWSVGATAVLYTGPKDVTVWPRLIRGAGATVFAAVPGLYRRMLKYGDLTPGSLGTLRHGLAAGESLSPALLEAWRAATGLELYEALGMSECSTFISCGPDVPVRPGSPGRPQPGRKVAVLPEDGGTTPLPAGERGLLAIHRDEPGLMLGYWRRPDEDAATWRGDWFTGGDLVRIDADGYVWFDGRADDVMNAGGYRVSPMEVEAALAPCPGIAEVAVAEREAAPDLRIIVAFVVRRPGSAIDERAVLDHAAATLADYKRPRAVRFVEALPRNANGKLHRRDLGA